MALPTAHVAAAPARAGASKAPPETTAIIAWHGMGQQLPFATVADVAEALARHHARLTGGPLPRVTARDVTLGHERLRRAEISLPGPDGAREVHVYEAYWAPLTEGRITLPETVRFLIAAGIHGVRYAICPPQVLDRFLFGRWVAFRLKPSLALVFLVLLLTLASLIIVNTAVVGTLALKLVIDPGVAERWPSYALLRDLTADLAVLAVPFVALGVSEFLAYRLTIRQARLGTQTKPRPAVAMLIWGLIALTIVGTLVVGALVAYHVVVRAIADGTMSRGPWSLTWLTAAVRRDSPTLWLFGAVLVWLVVLAGSAVIRWFLLEFVGDTAIYLSSHVLNRFFETRDAIKSRSCSVAGAIYRHGGYGTHLLMGHSLGSVIAYDTLNRLIVDDNLAEGKAAVVARTGLLVTFGSVLDKTAFLFRAQTDQNEVREALASVTQPLISDPTARPRWVNIFSRRDVFGGALDYYDPSNGTVGDGPPSSMPCPIINIEDTDAWIPLIAHTQYWTNRALLDTLLAAIH